MTVIAVRNGIIAADSQFNNGNNKMLCTKLFRVPDGVLGLAGDSGPGFELLHWLQKHSCSEPIKTDEYAREGFDAILVTKSGIYLYEESLAPDVVTGRFFAIGCGGAAAYGAMHMGASACEAVRIACKIDANCGGPVKWMKVS